MVVKQLKILDILDKDTLKLFTFIIEVSLNNSFQDVSHGQSPVVILLLPHLHLLKHFAAKYQTSRLPIDLKFCIYLTHFP